ncbi:MAG: hypothetical protein H8E38_13275 [SAR324 cluster bacterium]|nr:hypothetical protein [SAR324 cluster bacterium]MBL7034738.1 hypothetical protein [SAR324 cluster bacterium]
MKKKIKKITREQIRVALEYFYAQGGKIQVLPPQKNHALSCHNLTQIIEEIDSFDDVPHIPKDLDYTIRNSMFINN